jgi:D-3-phosphoglycerate dehydrogenase
MTIERNYNQKVLIIDDFHPVLLTGLKQNQFDFEYKPGITQSEVFDIIGSFTGLIMRSKINCNKLFFEKAVNLKWIVKGASGMDNIDEKEAKDRGIKLINAPEGNKDAVAEHALGLMLNLTSKINYSFQQVKRMQWNREQNRGIEIKGKTIGIIGYGNNGAALAKKLSGFEVEILAYDKYSGFKTDTYAKSVSMDEIFEKSDWLSLHIPLTDETRGLVNLNFLTNFKKSIGLINTSRGEIVKANEVLKALHLGILYAFGADVLENEKLNTWDEKQIQTYTSLMQFKNVVITPHIAGWTLESYERISKVILDRIIE